MLTFSCVTANHLGLITAMERVIHHPIPIANCPKCFTFWSVLTYGIVTVPCVFPHGLIAAIPRLLAISFLCSYLAIWLELLEGFIDIQFNKIYATLYPTANYTDTAPTTQPEDNSDSTLPHLPEGEENNKENED